MAKDSRPRAVVLEDRPGERRRMVNILKRAGFGVAECPGFEEAIGELSKGAVDAFVVDLQLEAGHTGIEFLGHALDAFPKAAVAVVSAYVDDSLAAELSRFFFERSTFFHCQISKPAFDERLQSWAAEIVKVLQDRTGKDDGYHTEDSRVRTLREQVIPVVARSGAPVLIIGESGTGKEQLARMIHDDSNNPQRQGPFVPVNCAAVSDQLILSDLFGHVMGAFTGAMEHRLGWFLEASGWLHESATGREARNEIIQQVMKRLGVDSIDKLYQLLVQSGSEFSRLKAELTECLNLVAKVVDKASGVKAYLAWLSGCGNDIGYARAMDACGEAAVKAMGRSYWSVATIDVAEYVYAKGATPGTLFLDEVGDLSPAAEVALLRALDGYGLRPVGYSGPSLLPDCRIIAATNRIRSHADIRDPAEVAVTGRGMRRDLFWRLAGWVLELPPLRDRVDEDGVLEWMVAMRRRAAREGYPISSADLKAFAKTFGDREWSGNWRELWHVYVRARARAEEHGNQSISRDDLDFASRWVLVDSEDVSEATLAGNTVQDRVSDGGTTEVHNAINPDVESRLDCVLLLDWVLGECGKRSIALAEVSQEELATIAGDEKLLGLGLMNDVFTMARNRATLAEAVKRCAGAKRVVRDAVEILRGATGFTGWLAEHAGEVIEVVGTRQAKYSHIVPLLRKLSPSHLSALAKRPSM